MAGTAIHNNLTFHVERLHTAAAEGNVNYLLKQRYNFCSHGVHIHIVCESFTSIK